MIGETKMASGKEEDLTSMVPIDAYQKGMRLILRDPMYQPDPVYLLDKDGVIIEQWEHIPSIGEVDDACNLRNLAN
jgi:hypothetical protein